MKSIESVDCSFGEELEVSYYCINCFNGHKLFYSIDSNNCSDSHYLDSCTNCTNCLGCINLTNKKYHIFNKEYSKGDYFIELERLKKDKNIEKKVKNFHLSQPHLNLRQINCENCNGDYIHNGKNVKSSFDCWDSENVSFSASVQTSKDMMDISRGFYNANICYEGLGVGVNVHNVIFANIVFENIKNAYYCTECVGIQDCFACIGLRNAQYCILNKQYTKEQYEETPPILPLTKGRGRRNPS